MVARTTFFGKICIFNPGCETERSSNSGHLAAERVGVGSLEGREVWVNIRSCLAHEIRHCDRRGRWIDWVHLIVSGDGCGNAQDVAPSGVRVVVENVSLLRVVGGTQ